VRSPVRKAPKLPFVAVVVLLLSAGLVGLLLLSMQRGQASFRQSSLATSDATLSDQVQALQREVEQDQDPSVLASRAAALGMVPESSAGYLGSSGQILGKVPTGAPVPAAGETAAGGVVVATAPVTTTPTAAVRPASRPTPAAPIVPDSAAATHATGATSAHASTAASAPMTAPTTRPTTSAQPTPHSTASPTVTGTR
jgi:hypothetical protein